jgi:hypothetical protein
MFFVTVSVIGRPTTLSFTTAEAMVLAGEALTAYGFTLLPMTAPDRMSVEWSATMVEAILARNAA